MKIIAFLALAGAVSADQILEIENTKIKGDAPESYTAVTDEPNGCMSDIDLVKAAEGFRSCEYKDSQGIPTICYGYNLKSHGSSEITKMGYDYSKVMAGSQCISQSDCTTLL